jgi:hypothetical protein
VFPIDVGPPIDVCPPKPPGVVFYAEPSWRALSRFVASIKVQMPIDSAPAQSALAQKTVEIVLTEEGLDARGRWYQRFEVVIGPGGTIADAALAVYGDERRAPDLLEIIKERQPNIDVRRVPVGLRIDIIVDPTVAFVLKDSRREGDWEIRSYFNGAIERRRVNARVVILPADKPGKEFAVPGDTSDRPISAGARLLEYQYRAGENFEYAVGLIYEDKTVAAMKHFISQTSYDLNNWPPPALDKLRVVILPGTDMSDYPIQELENPPRPERSPATDAQLQEQRQARLQAGIVAVAYGPFGKNYRIRVASARLTARQVASLLYNDPEKWKGVAAAAGIDLPAADPPPDVRLQGRDFEVQIAYEDEAFLWGEPVTDAGQNTKTSRLLNGTEIIIAVKGPNRHVILPTGYRKATQQPIDLVLAIARLQANIRGKNDEEIARLLWDWDPGAPRRSGDVVQSAALVSRRGITVIEVTVQSRPNVVDLVGTIRRWAPYVFAIITISLGILLVVLAGRSAAPKTYRRRW